MCLSHLQVFKGHRKPTDGVTEARRGRFKVGISSHWCTFECDLGPLGLIETLVSWGQRPYYRGVDIARGRTCVKASRRGKRSFVRPPIFNQKGYDGAALSDLMRATGLEKGGIYRHFGSKQELAGDAFDHAWKIAIDMRFEGTDKIPNTVDRLKQIVRNFRDRRTGLVPGGCPLLNTAIDCDDGNPKLRAKARQALGSWLDRMKSIAEEGQRRGEVRSDVDSAKLATLIVSTLEGSHMVSRLQKKEAPRDLAVRHLEEYLEIEVRAPKSKTGADKS